MIPICILVIEDDSDREYMTRLYLEYQRLMYSSIGKVINDPWTIEDVLQSALEKLIDKIQLLKTLDQKRLINYVISTCKNTAYNELNKTSRHPIFSFDDAWDEVEHIQVDNSIENQLIEQDDFRRLVHIWSKLDSRSQFLLEARYILEKKPQEIAIELNMKPESVRMALTRARRNAYTLMKRDSP